MKEFIDFREFCLLKDPLDHEPKRDTMASGMIYGAPPFASSRGWSMGRCSVARYDVAKDAWDHFGGEEPPVGSRVYTMTRGSIAIVTVFELDSRCFQLQDPENPKSAPGSGGPLCERTQWYVWMVHATHSVATDRHAYLRWEHLTK